MEQLKKARKLYNLLIEMELFTEEELRRITNVNGFNLETLSGALYARFGYRNIDK